MRVWYGLAIGALVTGAIVGLATPAHAKEKGTGTTQTARAHKKRTAQKAPAHDRSAVRDKKAAKPPKEHKEPKEKAKPSGHGKTAKSKHAPSRRANAPHHHEKTDKAPEKKKDCMHPAVELSRAGDKESFVLTRCDGKPVETGVANLSVMMRPLSVPKPAELPTPDHGKGAQGKDKDKDSGIKMADPGLATRLQAIADHFKHKRIDVVSGYRPGSTGSYHKDARAVDIHVEGVKNEELVTFCRSLGDTGCGYYPNSSFVHVDVRPKGTGHVYWIDASGPGESPKYVSSWPPPKDKAPDLAKADPKAPHDEHTHPDAKAPKADDADDKEEKK